MNSETKLRGFTPLRILIVSAIIVLIVAGVQIMHVPTPLKSVSEHVDLSVGLNSSVVTVPHAPTPLKSVSGSIVTPVESNSSLVVSSTVPAKSSVSLAFFLRLSSEYFQDNLQVFKKNLKPGDYVLMRGELSDPLAVVEKVKQTKSLFTSGVNVNSSLVYYKIGDIVQGVPKLPPGIDFIVYDYEKGTDYSPEFTTNESKSLGYFRQAQNAVIKYNKNTGGNAYLMVTPPFGELRYANWNWGLAADHMNVMDMQLQAFVNNHELMKRYVSSTLDSMSKSKKHMIFVQVSLSRNNLQENLGAINSIRDYRVNAFLVWYQATQTAELEQFFNTLKR